MVPTGTGRRLVIAFEWLSDQLRTPSLLWSRSNPLIHTAILSEVRRFAMANRLAQSKDPFPAHSPCGPSGNFTIRSILQTPLDVRGSASVKGILRLRDWLRFAKPVTSLRTTVEFDFDQSHAECHTITLKIA